MESKCKTRTTPAPVQLNLFPEVIELAYLAIPDNPRGAFYRIWIEENAGAYSVCKESGKKGQIWDRRRWPVDSMEQARKLFTSKVKSKTNPKRKTPRKYQQF